MTTWHWKKFQELTTEELYDILALRQEVFVLEQKCLYPDIDHQDQRAVHLLGIDNGKLVAYLRLFPSGTFFPDAVSFGRVVTRGSERGKGLAKEAMNQVETYLKNNTAPVIISAQVYLKPFYATYGYRAVGEPYDEDGIPHIKMTK